MENERWYRVGVQRAHQGTGRTFDSEIYIWAENIIDVINRYKRTGGIKRRKTPNIRLLSSDEVNLLEQRILRDGFLLYDAKRKGYTPKHEY